MAGAECTVLRAGGDKDREVAGARYYSLAMTTLAFTLC